MPNWCMNKLTVEHDDPSMLDRFVQAYNKGAVCNEFIPKPKDVGDDWYDWCVSNWGTKWDVGADIGTEKEERYGLRASVVDNQANCSFDSAWAPPIGLYEELVELGYNVKASYFEPGIGYCGIWDNGFDNCIEYGDMENIKDAIPVALWNDFDMEEFFKDEVEA